jgi:hypothetical protein
VAYFRALAQHSLGETERIRRETSVIMVDNPAEISTENHKSGALPLYQTTGFDGLKLTSKT